MRFSLNELFNIGKCTMTKHISGCLETGKWGIWEMLDGEYGSKKHFHGDCVVGVYSMDVLKLLVAYSQ